MCIRGREVKKSMHIPRDTRGNAIPGVRASAWATNFLIFYARLHKRRARESLQDARARLLSPGSGLNKYGLGQNHVTYSLLLLLCVRLVTLIIPLTSSRALVGRAVFTFIFTFFIASMPELERVRIGAARLAFGLETQRTRVRVRIQTEK